MDLYLNEMDFMDRAFSTPLVDVRSPAEFEQGHIPGAINIPLFDNNERAEIGIAYKLNGREKAIDLGLKLTAPKLEYFITKLLEIAKDNALLFYCWRGGMRSGKFCEFARSLALNANALEGGYKAYRKLVLQDFTKPMQLIILGGATGSGKTDILKELAHSGEQIIDLEGLAKHKGSAFGAIMQPPQPTQQQFENNLHLAWNKLSANRSVWMEDESSRIGKVSIPNPLWDQMKKAPILRIDLPKPLRIQRLVAEYGMASRADLEQSLIKITRRLGGQFVALALTHLHQNELDKVVEIVLQYYDKAYAFDHEKNGNRLIYPVKTTDADPATNALLLLNNKNELEKTQATEAHG